MTNLAYFPLELQTLFVHNPQTQHRIQFQTPFPLILNETWLIGLALEAHKDLACKH